MRQFAAFIVSLTFAACTSTTNNYNILPDPDGGTTSEDADSATPTGMPLQSDGGTSDATSTAAALSSLYYVACLLDIAQDNPKKVISFYVTFVGTNPTHISFRPLVASTVPPAYVRASGTTGDEARAEFFYYGSAFSASWRRWPIPGAANPISGGEIEIQGPALGGPIDAKAGCSPLRGVLVKPEAAAGPLLDSNVCLFRAVNDGDQTPTFTSDSFHCP